MDNQVVYVLKQVSFHLSFTHFDRTPFPFVPSHSANSNKLATWNIHLTNLSLNKIDGLSCLGLWITHPRRTRTRDVTNDPFDDDDDTTTNFTISPPRPPARLCVGPHPVTFLDGLCPLRCYSPSNLRKSMSSKMWCCGLLGPIWQHTGCDIWTFYVFFSITLSSLYFVSHLFSDGIFMSCICHCPRSTTKIYLCIRDDLLLCPSVRSWCVFGVECDIGSMSSIFYHLRPTFCK